MNPIRPAGHESRSLDLLSDADPALLLRLSAVGPEYTGTIDELLDGMPAAALVEAVVVQGRPGRLALLEGDVGRVRRRGSGGDEGRRCGDLGAVGAPGVPSAVGSSFDAEAVVDLGVVAFAQQR